MMCFFSSNAKKSKKVVNRVFLEDCLRLILFVILHQFDPNQYQPKEKEKVSNKTKNK